MQPTGLLLLLEIWRTSLPPLQLCRLFIFPFISVSQVEFASFLNFLKTYSLLISLEFDREQNSKSNDHCPKGKWSPQTAQNSVSSKPSYRKEGKCLIIFIIQIPQRKMKGLVLSKDYFLSKITFPLIKIYTQEETNFQSRTRQRCRWHRWKRAGIPASCQHQGRMNHPNVLGGSQVHYLWVSCYSQIAPSKKMIVLCNHDI